MEQLTAPSSADGDVKKDQVLERMNKRHKERQNHFESKQEQRGKESLQQEGQDYFGQSFTERSRDIGERITKIGACKKAAAGGDLPSTDLHKEFADIMLEIKHLQAYVTTSTMFLADAKIKFCQQVINELTSSCEAQRQLLLPKKKFGFSSKKVASKLTKDADKADAPEKKKPSVEHIFNWTIANRRNAYICLSGDELNGKDITISNVQHCLVELRGHAGSVQIKNASECTFLCGPVARSLFVEQCTNSTIAVACQQLRLHTSTQTRIYLHVTCRAIIEDCKQIEIAAYNYDYADVERDFERAGLNKALNNYTDVADFNWLSPDVPSPHWSLLKDYAEPNWAEMRRNFNANVKVDNSIL